MASGRSHSKPKLQFFSLTRLHRDSNGNLRTHTSPMAIEQWKPYLDTFETLTIHARIDENSVDDKGYLLDHPRINFRTLPNYRGIQGFIRVLPRMRAYLAEQIADPGIFYATWAPSQIGPFVAGLTRKIGAPLLVVLIGDPEEVSKAIVSPPMNLLAAFLSKRREQRVISAAGAVVYVTLRTLQEKYPAQKRALTLARSDVRLSRSNSRKPFSDYETIGTRSCFSVIAVGSQQQNYKGHDILLHSVAELQQEGYDVRLTLVGQGALHQQLTSQARSLGLTNTTFVKSLGNSEAVSDEMKKHDIFVMPSRTEGMPKVLLEAMDAGVFAIGSRVGGIPEVLADECLFDSDSVSSLTERLRYFFEHLDQVKTNRVLQQEVVDEFKANHTGDLVLGRFLDQWVRSVAKGKGGEA